MSIAENIKVVQNRVARTCEKVKRDSDKIRLIAVSKTVELEQIQEAIDAGLTDFGESRVQDAWRKYQALGNKVHWHMIGHVQTNKAKRTAQFSDFIHSVDSIRLADELQVQAEKQEKNLDIFIQVNTSGEDTKFGFTPQETSDSVQQISEYSNLNIKGLMTIGAYSADEQKVRQCFKQLREIQLRLNERIANLELTELSMGMTNDFEIAIEEGATMLRVGRLIFGDKKY